MAILAQAVLAQDILAQAMLTQAILDPWPFWLAVLAQAMHKSKEDLLFQGGGLYMYIYIYIYVFLRMCGMINAHFKPLSPVGWLMRYI